jgi:hypothetical protein
MCLTGGPDDELGAPRPALGGVALVSAFVHTQFEAVIGLLVDLALFLIVRTVLTREIERRPPPKVPQSTDAAPPP